MLTKAPFVPHAARAEWHGVEPVPQNEAENSLCPIMYSAQYASAMSMFRAVSASSKPEYSKRTLDLTSELISLNPAHYTIWSFRYDCVLALGVAPRDELTWSRAIAGGQPKNYQIWQYRRKLISIMVPTPLCQSKSDMAASELVSLFREELDFSQQILSHDAKNYHTWSFRQWLIEYFQLWDESELSSSISWHEAGTNSDGKTGEMYYTERLLGTDLRNNSAWNHRFFMVTRGGNCNSSNTGRALEPALLNQELVYAKGKIAIAPNNISAWSYFRGLLSYTKTPLASEKEFVNQYIERPEPVVQALSFLLDILQEGERQSQHVDEQQVKQTVEQLAQLDWVRRKYWRWRGSKMLET